MTELGTITILGILAYACYYLLTSGQWLMDAFFMMFR